MTARAQFNNLTIWQLSILIAYNLATLPFKKNYFDFPGLSLKSSTVVPRSYATPPVTIFL